MIQIGESKLSVSDHIDEDGEIEIMCYSSFTWLTLEEAKQLIEHLNNLINGRS